MAYKVLFKFPSRGRPANFFSGLDSIVNNLYNTEDFHISCTLDTDDATMNNPEVISRIMEYENTSIEWGTSESKIHAVNRSMPDVDFDIIICMSDDMRFLFFGFDELIRIEFSETLDLLLHYPDEDAKEALATMYIAGRTYYNRRGFIYHPSYKSLWCDNEEMEVAKRLKKYKFINCPGIISHQNPGYGRHPKDEMFVRQQGDWSEDEKNYRDRKLKNFYL